MCVSECVGCVAKKKNENKQIKNKIKKIVRTQYWYNTTGYTTWGVIGGVGYADNTSVYYRRYIQTPSPTSTPTSSPTQYQVL